MKIGHYMPGSTIPGGMSSYLMRLVEAQRQAGHDVFIIDDSDALAQRAMELKLDILHLHALLWPPVDCPIPMVRTMHGHWPYCPSGSRYLKRPGVACERAYSLGGCLWGHFIDRCGSVRPATLAEDFRRTWKEMAQPNEILTLAISDFVRQQMIRSRYCAERIRVLHLPAPRVEASAPEATAPVFLFLGRLVPEKGVAWLIRAFAQVQSDLQLQIAGDGPHRPALEELSRSLGVAQRVHFLGWLDQQQTMEHLALARAVVVPSIWHEPAGLVTLEAAALGKAAIVSRVGGIPEYAEKLENCRVVEPNDVASLATAINSLAIDSSLAYKLGQAGLVNAKAHFGLDAHVRALDAAYQSAAKIKR